MRQLRAAEVELLTQVVERTTHDASLLAALERGQLTATEARALGDLATKELAERGFDADYKPTPSGLRLEDVIDALAET
jgi:hypothetical protein